MIVDKRLIWEICSVIGTVLLGALFHFVYAWSGDSPATQWFAATNESVWEHLKLIYWPSLLFTTGLSIYDKYAPITDVLSGRENDVWFGKSVGLFVSLCFVSAFFFAYTAGNPENAILAVDLVTFVVGVMLISVIAWFLRKDYNYIRTIFGGVLFAVFGVLFVVFSYVPPTDKFLWEPYEE
jgi:Family of unknown function (DUF6512)